MKRITIFTALLSAVVLCGMVFSGCFTYLAAGQGDDRNDQWAERWSGWYVQDLERNYGPEYPNTVIVNRYWHSTDIHAFHRNVYDWTRGCWIVEPEFRLSIGWTDGWFDWDFGWDWTWGHAYRPVYWHPPVWALRMWNPPMANFGWWPHHEWTRPYWGEWRHGHAYAFDHGYRHTGWVNHPTYYPDQPRIQERRHFAARRGADLRKMDRVETASWNAPSSRDSRKSGFMERSGRDTGNRQTDVPDRVIDNKRRTERQAVRRENRTIELEQTSRTRFPNREFRIPDSESRPSANPEFRTPNSDSRNSRSTTFGEARSSRRTERTESRPSNSEFRTPNTEFRTPNTNSRIPNTEPRNPNPETRFSRRIERTESRSSNSEFRTPNTEPRNQNPETRSSRRIERTESRPSNSEFRTTNPEPRKPNPEFRTPNSASHDNRSTTPEARSSNPQRRRR